MPMELLAKIRDENFPMMLTDAADVNSAAVLQAAKLIDADIPELIQVSGEPACQPPATIQRITRLGRIALDDRDKAKRRKSKHPEHDRRFAGRRAPPPASCTNPGEPGR